MDSLLFALKENKDWFEQTIIKNSAVLLRGYNVNNAQDFNEILETFGWDDIRYVRPAPRTHVYKRVWTANEGPLSEFIYYHHEMVLVIYISLPEFSNFISSDIILLMKNVWEYNNFYYKVIYKLAIYN
jgi:hypothetical protein